jgi:protein ImuB
MVAERHLRMEPALTDLPFAVVEDRQNMQVLASLSVAASAAGVRAEQPLRDAQAMCPDLLTRRANPMLEAAFLTVLRRWCGKYSPWVSEEAPDGLVVDLTGCAHLFGGEEALLGQVSQDCADLGLTVHAGIADTVGAAWALARYAGQPIPLVRSGDAIDQEAWATRSRAVKRRHWERGGPAPTPRPPSGERMGRIAAPGQTRQALGPLPVAALRIGADTTADLARLGLRRIDDLAGQPRAGLARRFGQHLVQRLDQAMGVSPEPVSPARPPMNFAVRLTLPEPIGLEADIIAALDRLLPAMAAKLIAKGRGARRVRLDCFRTDQTMQWVEVGLARPSADPERIRPLLRMKLGEVDPGFGIDCVRIEAVQTEPVHARQHKGHAEVADEIQARMTTDTALDDLMGRLGARVGLDAIVRMHPADSHIPEKTAKTLAATWSEPAADWPAPPGPRPLTLCRPELVTAEDAPRVPLEFRWRQQTFRTLAASGPERIAPEWWLDEPDWRSGVRDYWRVTTDGGAQLWLYYAHGAATSSGWFCQGQFA